MLTPGDPSRIHYKWGLKKSDFVYANNKGTDQPKYLQSDKHLCHLFSLTIYLIETPFNTFANRADPDQAALVRAA